MKKYVLVGNDITKKIYPKIYKILSQKLKIKFKYIPLELNDIVDYELLFENIRFGIYDGANIEQDNIDIQKYMDNLSEKSQIFSYSNCISNKNEELIGNNTDYNAIVETFIRNDINPKDKNIVIIGTGKKSKVVQQFLKDFRANGIFVLNISETMVTNTYNIKYINRLELTTLKNIDVVINTTNIGEYPLYDNTPLDIFNKIETKWAIDTIYYPTNTVFLMEYKKNGVITINGMYIEVVKAVKSIAVWLNDPSIYSHKLIDDIYKEIMKEVNNEYSTI